MDKDFKVDLKQLVEDLQAKTSRLEELEKELEQSKSTLTENEELIKSLTQKNEEIEKEKSDLYLKVAQNITNPIEETKKEDTGISFEEMINELGKGI